VLRDILPDVSIFNGNDLVCKNGYLFSLFAGEGVIRRVKTAQPPPEPITLNIDVSQISGYAMYRDIASYIPGTYAEDTGNYINNRYLFSDETKLTTEWASGAGNIDGILLHADMALGLGFLRQKAYLPITGEKADAFYRETFDWITDLARQDNGYWMVPVMMDAQKIYYNPHKIEEFGLTIDIFDTYESIWEASLSLLPHRNGELSNVVFSRPLHYYYAPVYECFQQELTSEPDFDTPEFRAALEHFMFYTDRDIGEIIFGSMAFESKPPYGLPTLFDLVFSITQDSDAFQHGKDSGAYRAKGEIFTQYDDLRILPLPKENSGDPNATIDFAVLVINPSTQYPEEMLALAESIMDAAQNPPPRTKFTDPPMKTMFFKDKAYYQNIYNVDSEQFDDLYRFYSNCYVPVLPRDVYWYLTDLSSRKATIDETVAAVDRYMKMLWREMQ
jgi:ABC-type glycerol-3-phosphate transport system substrate-binding protein